MKNILFLQLILVFVSMSVAAQQVPPANPLLVHSNAPIPFDKINGAVVDDALSGFMNLQQKRIDNLSNIAAGKHSLANTLMAFDELQYEANDLLFRLYLVSTTFTNDSLRDEASEGFEKLSAFNSNLFLDEKIYNALVSFSRLPAALTLSAPQKKYLKESLVAFEKNGMKLDSTARKEMEGINQKLSNLARQFDQNISASKDSLVFTEKELAGVPDNIKDPWKKGDSFIVYTNQPNYLDLEKYAANGNTRYGMYVKYNNRAYPANVATLDSLIYYRQLFANTLGFSTYAKYALVDKMAKDPTEVWKFLNDLRYRLKPFNSSYLQQLKKFKKETDPQLTDTIHAWDVPYYSDKFIEKNYQFDTEALKEYFEYNSTLKGMFTVYEKLLNIDIKETFGKPVWTDKVRTFDVLKDGKLVGSFYLDMFPRPGKYTHNETSGISQYRISNSGTILPVSVLICNVHEQTAEQPSLLSMYDLNTLFHEFGHLIHSLLCHPKIASQALLGIKRDFIEAPSQLLENWIYEYDALKLFARHYKTGQMLPRTLFTKMKQAQLADAGVQNIGQVYLGLMDFTFHDKYDSIRAMDPASVSESLYKIKEIPFVKGTHMLYSFNHLENYPANYYGYLWSKVFAQDIFSVFQKNGVMDTKTGIRYRRTVLEKGATEDEMTMLKTFLGREPNNKAFIRSLGL